MKARLFSVMALLTCIGSCPLSTIPDKLPAPAEKIAGDYVEARTASVFAGACHYNGERITTGRDAIMAWNFSSGSWKGVDLGGLRAMAAVTSDVSLGDDNGARKSELTVDSSATSAQASALADLLRVECGKHLGQIVAVRRADVTFEHLQGQYSVKADGFAAMTVEPMPDDECCKQPSMVWYSPLSPVDHRKVGYTQSAGYSAGTLADTWQREDENSAFYGPFSF